MGSKSAEGRFSISLFSGLQINDLRAVRRHDGRFSISLFSDLQINDLRAVSRHCGRFSISLFSGLHINDLWAVSLQKESSQSVCLVAYRLMI